MANIDLNALRKAIREAGHNWEVREVPQGEHHALGNHPSDPHHIQQTIAHRASARPLADPHGADRRRCVRTSRSSSRFRQAGLSIPSSIDWRTRGVIGPVTDQRRCGSCVSFATVGMAAAMAAIELGARDLNLSEADQHFCSSHGASCGGWNNADSLGQIKSRGVVTERAFPYMNAFDSPPVNNPSDTDVWIAPTAAASATAHTTHTRSPTTAVGRRSCSACRSTRASSTSPTSGRSSAGSRSTRTSTRTGAASTPTRWARSAGVTPSWSSATPTPRDAGSAATRGEPASAVPRAPTAPAPASSRWRTARRTSTTRRSTAATASFRRRRCPVVSGVSRSTDKLDVFAAGTSHGIYTAAWEPGDSAWQGWWQIAGRRRGAGHVDLRRLAQQRSPRRLRGRNG